MTTMKQWKPEKQNASISWADQLLPIKVDIFLSFLLYNRTCVTVQSSDSEGSR